MKRELTFLSRGRIILWISMMALLFLNPLMANNINFVENALFHPVVKAVPIEVSGIVTDQEGEPLIGVNILVKGTEQGTATDFEGRYELNDIDDDAVLVVSYIGYKTLEVPVEGQSIINITLKEDLQTLDEVVVVGYGEQSRATTTTAISKLNDKVLENVPYGHAGSALQGAMSGVRVQSLTGQPGSAPRIIIRGGTSINNPDGAEPLYVVDGIIRDDINDINTADIKSLQVLKDAASTSIYGSRGSNGVVLIEMKSGRTIKPQISYSYDLTASSPGRTYDMLNARDFIYFQRLSIYANGEFNPAALGGLSTPSSGGIGNDLTKNTAFTTQYLSEDNKYKLNEGWESMPDPVAPEKTIIFKNTDFQNVTYRTGISQNHFLNASGGNNNATFNASLGYNTEQGTVITTYYNRLTFNLSSSYKVRDNFKVFGKLMYSNSKTNVPKNYNVVFLRSSTIPPTTKYEFEDGTLAPGSNDGLGNMEYHLNKLDNKNSIDNLSVVAGAHWEIFPGLSFDPQASIYKRIGDARSFQYSGLSGGVKGFSAARNASANFNKETQNQVDAVFTYKNQIENHQVEGKLGLAFFSNELSGFNGRGRGAATDLVTTLNAAPEPLSVSGFVSKQLIVGYFSRVNYNFNRKYLLSISGRYDGASNLGKNNKWGFFLVYQ